MYVKLKLPLSLMVLSLEKIKGAGSRVLESYKLKFVGSYLRATRMFGLHAKLGRLSVISMVFYG